MGEPFGRQIGEIDEGEDDDGHGHHNGTDLAQEHPDAVHGLADDPVDRRHVVDGQLDDERGGVVPAQQGQGKDLGHDEAHEQRHRPDEEHGPTRVAAEKGPHQQQIQRDFGQTVHHGHDEDGGHPGPLIRDGTRGDDAGDGATAHIDTAEDQGQRGLAVQAETVEDPVEDEGDARHVAGILKDGHQGEHDDEDGQVVQHCRDTFDDPQPQRRQDGIFQKALLRQDGGGPDLQLAPDRPDLGGQIIAQRDGGLVKNEQYPQQDERAPETVAEDGIHLFRHRGDELQAFRAACRDVPRLGETGMGDAPDHILTVPRRPGLAALAGQGGDAAVFRVHGSEQPLGKAVLLQQLDGKPAGRIALDPLPGQQARDFPDIRFQLAVIDDLRAAGTAVTRGDGAVQFLLPDPLAGLGPDDRDAQRLGKGIGIHPYPPLRRHVHHVQHGQGGPPHLQKLQAKIQAFFQRRGIKHRHDLCRILFHDELPGGHLLRRPGSQAVRPGQVHQLDARVAAHETSRLFLDGHTGVIGHILAGAGEHVEDGRFAAIGLPGQNGKDLFHDLAPYLAGHGEQESSSICLASPLRSAT